MVEISLKLSITEEERTALFRFYETCEDGQEYDVPLPMMRRLAFIGLIRRAWLDTHVKSNVYEFTEIGISIVHPMQSNQQRTTGYLFRSGILG